MSKSGVYLVSAKPADEKSTYDNIAFTTDDHKVSYSTANGVDLEENSRPMPDRPYRGMGKEELLYFSSQPFWRRLRMILISIVLIGWLALIITVVALVLSYPRCRDPAARYWWQTEPVYRVYVPSFKDSDGDGIGDLNGVESKLDYIKGLGFGVISLSPFYKGDSTGTGVSLADFRSGDDMAITDHTMVGEKYGNISSFESLVTSAHDKGIYVVIDFIPNLTSKRHPWFVTSSSNSVNDKKNFYVWAGAGASVPNNWRNVYGGSAWLNDSSRNEWYLQQLSPLTADLNLRSNLVREELENVLNFWLDYGVDGFNVRHAAYLYEDYDLRDDQLLSSSLPPDSYESYEHIHSSNQLEVYGLMEEWRNVVKNHNKTSTEKLLMANVGGLDVSRLYSDCGMTGIQMPLNRKSDDLDSSCNGNCIKTYVDNWWGNVPTGKWANWMFGDEDSSRLTSRFNSSYSGAFAVLTYLMPGTPVVYCGDELGATGNKSAASVWEREQPSRAIFPWPKDDFCDNNCTAWTLPSTQVQSPLKDLLPKLAELRKEQSFKVGDYSPVLSNSHLFSFVREFDGESGYLVAINFSPETVSGDFMGFHDTVQEEATVALSYGSPDSEEEADADTTSLKIGPYGAVVVSWDYVAKEL